MVLYLAIIVEIRVEPDSMVAGGFQVDVWRGVGIVLRETHVKLEASVSIGSAAGTCDEDLKAGSNRVHYFP